MTEKGAENFVGWSYVIGLWLPSQSLGPDVIGEKLVRIQLLVADIRPEAPFPICEAANSIARPQ